MINEEFIASLDYLVATCLWPSIVDARSQAQYYRQRVAYYRHFDGRDGKQNWRPDLYCCLSDWQARFPSRIYLTLDLDAERSGSRFLLNGYKGRCGGAGAAGPWK